MADHERALVLARRAAGLAAGAGVELPAGLMLWQLAGGRPDASAIASDDPAGALQAAMEGALTDGERRRGAHYTPDAVADRVAALALEGAPGRPVVVDPACGGGALLLAAARHLAAGGARRATVAAELLWGADVDPLAAAVTEAVLALWSGGIAPAAGHIVAGDTLHAGAAAWPSPPAAGFDAVVGNPPFQAQLARSTARTTTTADRLRERFGPAVTPYVDTAALFLLVAVELARPGGRVALVQPQSTVASRDAGAVRATLAERSRLVELWAPREHLFPAKVHVCVPVLEVTAPMDERPADADRVWTRRMASARGVPTVDVTGPGRVGDRATVLAGFRQEYYGLVGHIDESHGPSSEAPLVTCGVIDVGTSAWGQRPIRFAKRTWQRPEVDLDSVIAADARMGRWLERVRRPKVVVASQTNVLEAAADHHGTWVPSTPVVSAVAHDAADVDHLTALVCSPAVSLWAAQRASGTALSSDALRISAALVAEIPLPADQAAWDEAAQRLREGDVVGFARAATAMFDLGAAAEAEVLSWWVDRAKLPGLGAESFGMVSPTSGVAR